VGLLASLLLVSFVALDKLVAPNPIHFILSTLPLIRKQM